MASFKLPLLLLAVIATHCLAAPAAPGPAAAGPVNLTAILEKGGQFTTFIRLLTSTQVGDQVNNQVNHSSEGMTVLAPTDNAFQNLKPGTINSLTTQEQVQLVLYHVIPKFYSSDNFQTVSNPVRTLATGNDGGVFGLTFTYVGVNNVNVSTGIVETQINNALRDDFPLAVYQVDKVLLPEELFGVKAPKSAPVSSSPAKGKSSSGKADAPAADEKNGANDVRALGLGFVATVGLATMALVI